MIIEIIFSFQPERRGIEVPRFVKGKGEIWDGTGEPPPPAESPLERRLLLGLVSARAAAVVSAGFRFVGDFCEVCISFSVAEWGGGEEAKFSRGRSYIML